MKAHPNIHVPHFPTYRSARSFLELMNGQSRRTLLDMRQTIWDYSGTPQETRDWTRPEEWIPAVLSGQEREVAQYLWEGSQGAVNPRHLTGVWLLCSSYELLVPDDNNMLHVTSTGRDFLENPFGETEQWLDVCCTCWAWSRSMVRANALIYYRTLPNFCLAIPVSGHKLPSVEAGITASPILPSAN